MPYICRYTAFFMELTTVTLAHTLIGHQNPIYALEKGYDPAVLYSAGNDKGIVEWDLETGKFKRILCSVSSSVYALKQFSYANILAVGLREGQVLLVDPEAQKLIAKLPTDRAAVFALAVLEQKKELIAVAENGYAYVWCLQEYKLLYKFEVANAALRSLAIHPEGSQIAIGDKNGAVHLYEVSSFQKVQVLPWHAGMVTALCYATDGNSLYSGSKDAHLKVTDLKTFRLKTEFIPHMFTIYSISTHPIYPILATVSRIKPLKSGMLKHLN